MPSKWRQAGASSISQLTAMLAEMGSPRAPAAAAAGRPSGEQQQEPQPVQQQEQEQQQQQQQAQQQPQQPLAQRAEGAHAPGGKQHKAEVRLKEPALGFFSKLQLFINKHATQASIYLHRQEAYSHWLLELEQSAALWQDFLAVWRALLQLPDQHQFSTAAQQVLRELQGLLVHRYMHAMQLGILKRFGMSGLQKLGKPQQALRSDLLGKVAAAKVAAAKVRKAREAAAAASPSAASPAAKKPKPAARKKQARAAPAAQKRVAGARAAGAKTKKVSSKSSGKRQPTAAAAAVQQQRQQQQQQAAQAARREGKGRSRGQPVHAPAEQGTAQQAQERGQAVGLQ